MSIEEREREREGEREWGEKKIGSDWMILNASQTVATYAGKEYEVETQTRKGTIATRYSGAQAGAT